MNRHVVTHRNYFSVAVEHRAGVVPALLDVGRKRRPPQRGTHLLGDGVVDVLEDFEFDRIAPHEAQSTTSRWSFACAW